jgi:hypothetical protein
MLPVRSWPPDPIVYRTTPANGMCCTRTRYRHRPGTTAQVCKVNGFRASL